MNFTKRKINKKEKKESLINIYKRYKQEKKENQELEINNQYENEETPKKKFNINISKKYTVILTILALSILILSISIAIIKTFKSIDYTVLLEAAGDELLVDNFGHTNFLILGKGGLNHDGSDLTDSILVVSLDKKLKKITILSVPRDLYIQDDLVGSSRINEVYYYAKKYYDSSEKGIIHLKDKIEEKLDLEIHYYFMVDFKGFKEIVDSLNGIEVYVETAIYDPFYPKDGTYEYETFSISEGLTQMDGELALKYARSRKTTSDFDRAKRQQEIMYAIKEKALSTKTLLSVDKINKLLTTIKANIETNLTPEEMLTLGSYAKDFNEESISHKLLHDDPSYCGGLLYTPLRELYGGMFILLPAGGDNFLQMYSNLLFDNPTIDIENTKIHILNGTKKSSAATTTKSILERMCFDVVRYGNGQSQEVLNTTYYYQILKDVDGNIIKDRPIAIDYFKTIIPGTESIVIPEAYKKYMADTDILIELGDNYVNSDMYISDPYYYMETIINTTPTKPITTETTSET